MTAKEKYFKKVTLNILDTFNFNVKENLENYLTQIGVDHLTDEELKREIYFFFINELAKGIQEKNSLVSKTIDL